MQYDQRVCSIAFQQGILHGEQLVHENKLDRVLTKAASLGKSEHENHADEEMLREHQAVFRKFLMRGLASR